MSEQNPEQPEIPAGMTIQRRGNPNPLPADSIAAAVPDSKKPESKPEETPVKRGPGRPPGSKNRTRPNPAIPPTNQDPPKTAEVRPKPPPIPPAQLNIKKDNKKDTPAPPSFDEWRDFLGEVVLHWFSVDFIAVAFRGIPYHEMMSQEDFEDIQLDDE